MSVKFSNNAKTTLSSGITSSATSIAVADGSVFPSISGSEYFYATLVVSSDLDLLEIVKVTAVSGNTLTAVRAQDGTSARAFSASDKCELRLTAAGLNEATDVGAALSEFPTGTDAVSTDLIAYYDGSSSSWELGTISNVALQGQPTR